MALVNMESGNTVNIDDVTPVSVFPGDKVSVEIKSNPTTGYSWTMTPHDSTLFQVLNLNGTYVAPGGRALGASGHQVFEIVCSGEATEGYSEEFVLNYARPWESAPVETKTFHVTVRQDRHL